MVVGSSATALIEGLLQIKEVGVKGAAKDMAVKASKANIGASIAKKFIQNPRVLVGSSYATAYITVLSTFLYYCSSKNEAAAKNELILRGLIKLDDL